MTQTEDTQTTGNQATGIKTKGLLHITISVTDLDRATEFYRDFLGCTFLRQNSSKTMTFMQTGDDYFVLTHMDNHVKPNPPGRLDIKTTHFHHAFIVEPDQYDRALELIEERGMDVYFCDFGHNSFPGYRQAYIHDPDGNGVELASKEA